MQNEDLHCTEIRIVTKNKQKPLINALFTLINITIRLYNISSKNDR